MSTARVYVFAVCISLVMLAFVGCGEDKPSDSGDNTAPLGAFAVSPGLGGTGTVFEFDASGSSDAEDTISALEVRWDWESDGWDTDWTTTKTTGHQYATTGQKTIRLQVKDTGGATDDTTQTVTVAGPGPMVLVPAGSFEMGDGVAPNGAYEIEVTLTHGFYLGNYEVTNQEYRDAVQWAYDHGLVTATSDSVNDNMDGNTALLVDLASGNCQISFSDGVFTVDAGKQSYPMVRVNWYGAAAYCDWLSLLAGLAKAYDHSTWQCNNGDPYTAVGYRLPMDAEWEYATQYSGERIYPWGDELPDCSRVNFYGDSDCVGGTSLVGSYPAAPASLDLYDMAGNVWEWCNDWLSGTPGPLDPKGPASGSHRVLHGGSWDDVHGPNSVRCAYRNGSRPWVPWDVVGFRCARTQQ